MFLHQHYPFIFTHYPILPCSPPTTPNNASPSPCLVLSCLVLLLIKTVLRCLCRWQRWRGPNESSPEPTRYNWQLQRHIPTDWQQNYRRMKHPGILFWHTILLIVHTFVTGLFITPFLTTLPSSPLSIFQHCQTLSINNYKSAGPSTLAVLRLSHHDRQRLPLLRHLHPLTHWGGRGRRDRGAAGYGQHSTSSTGDNTHPTLSTVKHPLWPTIEYPLIHIHFLYHSHWHALYHHLLHSLSSTGDIRPRKHQQQHMYTPLTHTHTLSNIPCLT